MPETRPMGLSRYNLIAAALISVSVVVPISPAPGASTGGWQSAAQRQATVLARVQAANGTFPAYNFARASGVLPYGESMAGYGLVDAGLANDDAHELHAGIRAIAFASRQLLRRGSPSVFENLALAAAYNRVRLAAPDD